MRDPANPAAARRFVVVIKSELIDRISVKNPHFSRQHAERIVNTIFAEIGSAMAARVWKFLRKDSASPCRQKSANWYPVFSWPKGCSFLQDRKRDEISSKSTRCMSRFTFDQENFLKSRKTPNMARRVHYTSVQWNFQAAFQSRPCN